MITLETIYVDGNRVVNLMADSDVFIVQLIEGPDVVVETATHSLEEAKDVVFQLLGDNDAILQIHEAL